MDGAQRRDFRKSLPLSSVYSGRVQGDLNGLQGRSKSLGDAEGGRHHSGAIGASTLPRWRWLPPVVCLGYARGPPSDG
jgi:hypothetical protein